MRTRPPDRKGKGELTQCHPAHESRYLGVARIDLFPRWKRIIAAVGGVCTGRDTIDRHVDLEFDVILSHCHVEVKIQ